jgi:hypothetical protein
VVPFNVSVRFAFWSKLTSVEKSGSLAAICAIVCVGAFAVLVVVLICVWARAKVDPPTIPRISKDATTAGKSFLLVILYLL